MKKHTFKLSFIFAFCAFFGSMNAALITFTDRATFEAAVGSFTIEDFSSYGANVPFHGAGHDVGDFTLTTTSSSTTNNVGSGLMTVHTAPGTAMTMTFDNAITAFAADFFSFQDSIVRSHVTIDGTTVIPPIGSTFYGVISDVAFNSVEISAVNWDWYQMDNVTYGGGAAVPEPSTYALMALGLLGLGAYRRKRKA